MALNEADTCRVYVTPKLRKAGWEALPHSLTEQYVFTDGRVEVGGQGVRRGEQKRADYLLRFNRDFPIAVVEAKAWLPPLEWQQKIKTTMESLSAVEAKRKDASTHMDALLPSILDKAFKDDL